MEILASRMLLRPRDLERSVRFYEETLGLAVFREWGEGPRRAAVFFAGGGLLEVSGSPPAEPPSEAVRLLFQVRDISATRERLAARGVAIEEEPERKPWGLDEMVVLDPDGLRIVLVEVPPDHPQRRRP